MRKSSFLAACALVLGTTAWGSGVSTQDQPAAPEAKGPRILDEIVAKVNNEIITLTDLNRSLRQLRLALEQDVQNRQELEREYERRRRGVLKTIIQNKIMIQRAEELGMTADIDLDVSAYLEEMRKEAGIPSLDVLDQYFRQRGSSLAEYRQNVKEQMITRALLQNLVYSKITLLTSEVEAYYKEHLDRFTVPAEVHLAEILFLTEGKNKAEVRRKAEEVSRRLKEGEDFEALAREYSDGPTASRGGDIGTFPRGSMNPALEQVVFDLPEGAVSAVIESDYGYQIVKVLHHKPATAKPMSDVRPQIAEALYQRKAEPEVQEFLKHLYEESYIYVAPKYAEQYDVAEFGL